MKSLHRLCALSLLMLAFALPCLAGDAETPGKNPPPPPPIQSRAVMIAETANSDMSVIWVGLVQSIIRAL